MTAFVLLNPYANRWQAGQQRAAVEDAFRRAGVDYTLAVTERPRHALDLVAEAVQAGYAPIVAAGGDGTIGEVVNGIARGAGEAPWPPLGVLPLGTANDLVDNVGLPRDLNAAVAAIARGQTRPMDVLRATVRDAAGNTTVWYSVNNTALGLEPTITRLQQEMRWAKGTLRYLLATLRGILKHPIWQATLQWEGGEYRGPANLVSVGNHRRTGGLFYMTPHANGFDSLLTFIYGHAPTRRRVLQALPHALRAEEGNIATVPEIHEVHSPWLEVSLTPPSPFHADGELYVLDAVQVRYEVLAGKVKLVAGN